MKVRSNEDSRDAVERVDGWWETAGRMLRCGLLCLDAAQGGRSDGEVAAQ